MWSLRKQPATSPPSGRSGWVHRAGPAEWRSMPAMPTVQARSFSTVDAVFDRQLATRGRPLFLETLGHQLTPDGPSGVVAGLAMPAAAEPSATASRPVQRSLGRAHRTSMPAPSIVSAADVAQLAAPGADISEHARPPVKTGPAVEPAVVESLPAHRPLTVATAPDLPVAQLHAVAPSEPVAEERGDRAAGPVEVDEPADAPTVPLVAERSPLDDTTPAVPAAPAPAARRTGLDASLPHSPASRPRAPSVQRSSPSESGDAAGSVRRVDEPRSVSSAKDTGGATHAGTGAPAPAPGAVVQRSVTTPVGLAPPLAAGQPAARSAVKAHRSPSAPTTPAGSTAAAASGPQGRPTARPVGPDAPGRDVFAAGVVPESAPAGDAVTGASGTDNAGVHVDRTPAINLPLVSRSVLGTSPLPADDAAGRPLPVVTTSAATNAARRRTMIGDPLDTDLVGRIAGPEPTGSQPTASRTNAEDHGSDPRSSAVVVPILGPAAPIMDAPSVKPLTSTQLSPIGGSAPAPSARPARAEPHTSDPPGPGRAAPLQRWPDGAPAARPTTQMLGVQRAPQDFVAPVFRELLSDSPLSMSLPGGPRHRAPGELSPGSATPSPSRTTAQRQSLPATSSVATGPGAVAPRPTGFVTLDNGAIVEWPHDAPPPASSLVQRLTDEPPAVSDAGAVPPSNPAATATTTTAAASPGPSAAATPPPARSEAELDELCLALYAPLRRRLCRDLLLDRERAGYRTDIRF